MKKQLAEELLQKYIDGKCTEHEKALVESWYLKYNLDKRSGISFEESSEDLEDIRASLLEQIVKRPRKLKNWYRTIVAAAIVLAICTIGFLIFSADKKESAFLTHSSKEEILPGGDFAILTLSDGSKIVLNDVPTGQLADGNGIKITKSKEGQLIYTVVQQERKATSLLAFNIIETPNGGQYQINLPDGTKVWLNAASSLRFPESFEGSERNVELKGEAYFEVAKDKNKPFKVKAGDTHVEVLGTHFNVMAYKGEQTINTTLLEGKVKVSKGDLSQIISPGQQTRIGESGQIQVVTNIDVEEVIAWKNGTFNFNNTDLKTVMRQLERWYNVEADVDQMPKRKFNGIISRNVPLSQVLKMMEVTSGLKFQVEAISSQEKTFIGRRIIMTE